MAWSFKKECIFIYVRYPLYDTLFIELGYPLASKLTKIGRRGITTFSTSGQEVFSRQISGDLVFRLKIIRVYLFSLLCLFNRDQKSNLDLVSP
jgi:hypothetical protein